MRKPNLPLLGAVLLGIVTLGLSASHPSANQVNVWGVVVASNAFVTRGDGAAAPIATGAHVLMGDRLTTKPGGALVLSRGEDLVTMAENSEILIANPQPVNATLIQQPTGSVSYHVTKKAVPHFEVDTPLLATVVKGTTFTVAAGAAGSSVTVTEGRVEARDRRSGQSSAVSAGQSGKVTGGRSGVSVGAASKSAASGSSSDTSGAGQATDQDSSTDNSGTGSSGSGNSGSGNGNGGSGSGGGNGNSGGNGGSGGGSGSGGGNGNGGGNGGGNGNGNNGNGNGNGGGNGSNGNGHGHGNSGG